MSFSSLFSLCLSVRHCDGLAIVMRTRPGVTVETVGKTGSSLPDLTTLHNASRDATKSKGKLPWRETPRTHTSLFHSSLPSLLFSSPLQIFLLGFDLLYSLLTVPIFHNASISLSVNCWNVYRSVVTCHRFYGHTWNYDRCDMLIYSEWTVQLPEMCLSYCTMTKIKMVELVDLHIKFFM